MARETMLRETAARRRVAAQPVVTHPGEVLRERYMVPQGVSANALALALRVPATRISEICRERRGITADTAFRLSMYFETTAEMWMDLQKRYELAQVERGSLAQIRKEVQRRTA